MAGEVKEIHPHAVDLVYAIKENYKGNLTVTKKTMPGRVHWQEGKEYLLFMVDSKGETIELAAYDGAVICEDDELFEKAIDMLEKKN